MLRHSSTSHVFIEMVEIQKQIVQYPIASLFKLYILKNVSYLHQYEGVRAFSA